MKISEKKEILQKKQMILLKLTEALQKENAGFWLERLEAGKSGRMHIAVMTEPYLSLVISGEKTMEARFSKRKQPPWGNVAQGDTVKKKKSGGGYVGIFEAGSVRFSTRKAGRKRRQFNLPGMTDSASGKISGRQRRTAAM